MVALELRAISSWTPTGPPEQKYAIPHPDMDSAGSPGFPSTISGVEHRVRNVLTALPKLVVDKLFWGSAPRDEEINLGKLKVITGSKYRQYCRAKYGPNFVDLFAQKYLPQPPTEAGRFEFITGPRAIRFYRNLLG
jgi:hypothetical protein